MIQGGYGKCMEMLGQTSGPTLNDAGLDERIKAERLCISSRIDATKSDLEQDYVVYD